jgi:phosphoglycerate-specific signal transduction histidine kinase
MIIKGTQGFLVRHKDHNLHVFINELIQSEFSASISIIEGGTLFVTPLAKHNVLPLEAVSAYLFCTDCEIEEEINLFEVE